MCFGLARYIADLRVALVQHPETHDDVGEAGTDVVVGYYGACYK